MIIPKSKRHARNLTALQESNYMKLLRVVPFIFYFDRPSTHHINHTAYSMELTVLEVTRYTTSISLTTRHHAQQNWLTPLAMVVRCYHDARVAEVINFQHHCRFKSKYDYPNAKMYQKNEKLLINRFLGEWLDHCLKTNTIFNLFTRSVNV